MDRPSIDDLLRHVGGFYDLATVAAKRAVEIKRKEKGSTQPLQKALDEISRGEVNIFWRNRPEDGEQIELPLEVGVVSVVEATEALGEETAEVDDESVEESEEEHEAEAEEVHEAEVEEEETYTEVDEDAIEEENFTDDADED
jgi:DNA-directed RNA polymerase omega subunit